MNSDARRSAAPAGDPLSQLLQRVLDVVELPADGRYPDPRRDGDGQGLELDGARDGARPAARPRTTKGLLAPDIPARSAGARQAYDELVVALLRLLVENHPGGGRRGPAREVLSDGNGLSSPRSDPEQAEPARGDALAGALSKLLSLVDLRRSLLPDVSPYDESWTLLLCAALAEREGRGVSVSELCRRIGCALATGQRRVDRLERLELLDRAPDPDDLRRHSVFPTEKGRKAAQDYAAAVGGRGLLGL